MLSRFSDIIVDVVRVIINCCCMGVDVMDEFARIVDGKEVFFCPKCERELPKTMFRQDAKGNKKSQGCLDCLKNHAGRQSETTLPKGFDPSYFCSGCYLYEERRSSWSPKICFGHQCLRYELFRSKKLLVCAPAGADAPIPEVVEKQAGSLAAVLVERDVSFEERDQSEIVKRTHKARYNKVGSVVGYEVVT